MTKRTATPTEVQLERDQATHDYNEEMQAVKDRTAKLRAERLAREADPQFVPVAPAPAKKPAKAKAKPKTKSTGKSASKAAKPSLEASPEAES